MKINKLQSSELDGMIYGMILGDAHIRKFDNSNKSCLIMHHSHKQKEYLLWKKELLSQISHTNFNVSEKKTLNKKVNKVYSSIFMQSNRLIYFRKIRDIFYDKTGRKFVNSKILNKLTPLGLAIWYMDDGCIGRELSNSYEKKFRLRPFLSTHSFSKEENLIIKEYFKKVWNIEVQVAKHHGKNLQYFVRFSEPEFKKFVDIIKDYVIPSMQYKIDLEQNNYASQAEEKSSDSLSV